MMTNANDNSTQGSTAAEGAAADKSQQDLRARFATLMEADKPVNPDEEAEDQFTAPPPAEQNARDER